MRMINSNHVCQLCNGCIVTEPNKDLLPFYETSYPFSVQILTVGTALSDD